MPTIDIRGQAPGAGGSSPGGGKTPGGSIEDARRKAMVQAYQNMVRREIDQTTKDRLAQEQAQKKELLNKARATQLQQRAQERDMRDRMAAQRRATQEAARAEKHKMRSEESEIKKKQKAEQRAAEKAEREKLRTEQTAIKTKQKAEEKAAKDAEREKLKAAKEAIVAQKKQQQAAAAQVKQQAQQQAQAQRAATQAQRATAQAQKAAGVQARQQQVVNNRASAALTKMQPKFARQQAAILAHFAGQNAPPGGGGGGVGGGAAPGGRPVFKHNASDILAESLSGAAIAAIIPSFVKILAAGIGAAIEAPLITGQIQRGMLSLAGPMIDLQKGSYALGRAGGFSGKDLTNLLYPGTGTEAGSEWMSRYMTTPQKVLDSLNAFGIVQPNAWKSAGLGETFARQALMPGFSGMGEGTVESTARQRVGYTGMGPQGIDHYLSQIGGAMELAVARGMDRSKILDAIESSTDNIAKSGAAGLSTKSMLDMIARFGAAGTPGGRTGEQAASAMGALSQFSSAPSSNPGMMFMAYSQMKKYGGLRTESDIKDFVGAENWNAASPKVRSLAVRDIMGASASGNPFAAFQIASSVLMGANPGRMAELVQGPLSKAAPSYLRTAALGSILGSVQNSYAYAAGGGATSPMGASELKPGMVPPGVGSAENSAAQATLSGANIALQNFVPIVKQVGKELEDLGHTVFTVRKAYEALHDPGYSYPGWGGALMHNMSLLGQPGQPWGVTAVPVNPGHQ